MPTKKQRFSVVLEAHESSEATGITIPFDPQEAFGARTRVPVRGTINGHPFRSSVFTMRGHTFMAVNREMREGAKAKAGDTVKVVMERDDEPRVITPPDDLARALRSNKAANAAWDKLSYTHQKEWARSVEEAKRPETRARRVEKAIAEMAAGRKPK